MAENKKQNTTQANTTNNQNKKDAAKSGLHKAVPIILSVILTAKRELPIAQATIPCTMNCMKQC